MLSPRQKKDKVIRSTDLDALSCRLNCNEKGYFIPPDPHIEKLVASYSKYLQFCQGYTNLSAVRTFRLAFSERKFPLINRGTYIRTQLISLILDQFVEKYGKCQIISMGGGSDTRCFKYLAKNVKYVEIDYPETTRIKKLTILNNEELKAIVGTDEKGDVENKEQFAAMDADLHTENYHLMGFDLRDLKMGCGVFNYIDTTIPTLVLSECVLCYCEPIENERIISTWIELFQQNLMLILVYEPISLNDGFGTQMSENLLKRGINLLTFNEFPTLDSKKQFLTKLGMVNVKTTNISGIGGYDSEDSWFGQTENSRVNSLELIDEVEEIKLLLLHYCLFYGENGKGDQFKEIEKLFWKI